MTLRVNSWGPAVAKTDKELEVLEAQNLIESDGTLAG
jgi:hypothetical protein